MGIFKWPQMLYPSVYYKKSPGPDGILNEMIKTGKFTLVKSLKKLMQLMFDSGYFPAIWNKGILVKLFKSGDPMMPDNYRGVILSSSLGKFMSLLLTKRIQNFLTHKDLLNKFQCGFREDHRTSDNLYILSRVIRHYKSQHRPIYACFIDFQKAFDRVNRDALLVKLLQIGVGGKFYDLVKQMHLNNLVCVRFGDKISDYFECNIGVRQGDSLSPTLFNIFINDLANDLDTCTDDAVRLGQINIPFLFYADDLVLLSETEVGLQALINCVEKYCQKWALQINKSKSKIMVFNKNSTEGLRFTVGGDPLEIVKQYKYLGIIISKSGSFSQAICQLSNKALKCSFAMRKYLSCCSYVPVEVLVHCFDALIKPILLYGAEIWGQDLLHNTKGYITDFVHCKSEIERIHLKFCKWLLNGHGTTTNLAVLSELGRTPMVLAIIQSVLRYFSRLEGMSSTRVIKQAYDFEKDKKFHLYDIVKHICEYFGIDLESYKFTNGASVIKFNKTIPEQLRFSYEEEWFISLSSDKGKSGMGNKLRTYKSFKRCLTYEKYLSTVTNITHRTNLTRLRLSAHDLRIERGRYERENNKMLPENKRICKFCTTDSIEDEYHFVMSCPLYARKRQLLFDELSLNQLNEKEIFLKLMSSRENIISSPFSKYVTECLDIRNTSR